MMIQPTNSATQFEPSQTGRNNDTLIANMPVCRRPHFPSALTVDVAKKRFLSEYICNIYEIYEIYKIFA